MLTSSQADNGRKTTFAQIAPESVLKIANATIVAAAILVKNAKHKQL